MRSGQKELKKLYLISGDEPLLVQEARDAIFIAAKQIGFSEKETVYVDSGFQVDTLTSLLYNASLFGDKKIIDLRNPAAKFDATLTACLQYYLEGTITDRVLIITTEKLTLTQQKSMWLAVIKKYGIFMPIQPIDVNALPKWIMERAKKSGVILSIEMATIIAAGCEGNLLAAQQMIEKLSLLFPHTEINKTQLMSVLADHARFTIFDLSDAITKKNSKKMVRIVSRLQQMGEEPTLILWAICQQLRKHNNKKTLINFILFTSQSDNQ